MNQYLKHDEWSIIEEGFNPMNARASESIFSLGNGAMGQRANFEERYSGKSLQGSYVAGVYYPDKTRVGWWKNGYPEYFAKVINSTNWIGINVLVNGEHIDLAVCKIDSFTRTLNMKEGFLERKFVVEMPSGIKVKVNAKRFLSMSTPELSVIRYSVTPLNAKAEISLQPYLDGNVINEDSNYDEKFWNEVEKVFLNDGGYLITQTKKLDYIVGHGMMCNVTLDEQTTIDITDKNQYEKYIGCSYNQTVEIGQTLTVIKYVAVISSLNCEKNNIGKSIKDFLNTAVLKGYNSLIKDHIEAWADIWVHSDITVEGDIAAQQGIRFNIFQLSQTYTGKDERLNIGPKGFTGEKYGGSTYWDTEAYCLPFYLGTHGQKVARQLLLYRYKHLEKAILNASKLGFKDGAALYPMVTMNGEECHNEWEITFEEIHRNGAIAFAIFNYVRYTGDSTYLANFGLEVLIAISRFWVQRFTYSESKSKYVMLGVTGPNEYENNVNNNWYTSTIASWCLEYTEQAVRQVKQIESGKYKNIIELVKFDEIDEIAKWQEVRANVYLPYDEKHQVFLQQEGYMDKEQILVKDLEPSQRPINQKWSWDRILRSCFIKQADVLQGIYLFEDQFDIETIKRNFEFYENRTVHESSLSPCVHSILASKIGKIEQAYNLYLRTARLDLDDYNKEVHEGLHITSMAGTWMSIVEGFGGMRIQNDILIFNPCIPKGWKSFSFKIWFRDNLIKVKVAHDEIIIINEQGPSLTVKVWDKSLIVNGGSMVKI
ncbi:MAG: glycoside hydrolase family 65 protein [Bacteroidales bacterium]|nr:glycoside hydrolase family 65 protein [Bacteroidales bacterium]